MQQKYDYLIVGAGLFGAVFAHEAVTRGKTCLVIDRRGHIGGNIHCEEVEGIQVHCYGAHIFHTSDKEVWDYAGRFVTFNHFVNSPVAIYKDELYNLPFNMNTFSKLWGVRTPAQAQEKIQEQIAELEGKMEAAACDYERLTELTAEREAAQAALDTLYEKWEQLSEEAGE